MVLPNRKEQELQNSLAVVIGITEEGKKASPFQSFYVNKLGTKQI